MAIAVAAGMFLVMVGGAAAFRAGSGNVFRLVHSKEIVRLQDELRSRPRDESVKAKIRQLDLELRQEMFSRLQLSRNASRALVAGLAVFLASAHFVRACRRRLPDPQSWGERTFQKANRSRRLARYSTAGTLAAVAALAAAASLRPLRLPESALPGIAAGAGETFPSTEETRWPTFRGPAGLGIAPEASATATWNAADGTNILWKTAVPLHGLSSPVVWGTSVFVTGADKSQSSVFRFDAETGELQWSATIKLPGGERPPTPEVMEETSLAAPTPATDGRSVYAVFPTGEVAAFDFSGKQVWARNISPLGNTYGYASSLAIYEDRLLIQIDRGQPEDGQSRLLALDTRTGQPLWEAKRDVAGSWSSPVVFDIGGQPQLITCASPFVIAYSPADGRELWRNKCLEGDVAPSPILAGGLIVAVAPNADIIGIRPGAAGIEWKAEDGVPDATSPVSDGQRVYAITSSGQLTCYNLQTGQIVWTHELEDEFYASPTIVGSELVLVSRKGASWVLATGDAYKELGRGELGEECCASPVPLGNRLLLRGKNNLYCIGSK